MPTITLTKLEAAAVLKAMGNSIDSRDDAKDILLTNAAVAAAYRAAAKISAAVYGSQKRWGEPGPGVGKRWRSR